MSEHCLAGTVFWPHPQVLSPVRPGSLITQVKGIYELLKPQKAGPCLFSEPGSQLALGSLKKHDVSKH